MHKNQNVEKCVCNSVEELKSCTVEKRERERGNEKMCLNRCDCALAFTRPAHGTRVAGTKRPCGMATRHQRQAKILGKRETEIAKGEENEGGVRTCSTSCPRTHHSCKKG